MSGRIAVLRATMAHARKSMDNVCEDLNALATGVIWSVYSIGPHVAHIEDWSSGWVTIVGSGRPWADRWTANAIISIRLSTLDPRDIYVGGRLVHWTDNSAEEEIEEIAAIVCPLDEGPVAAERVAALIKAAVLALVAAHPT